MTIFKRRDAIDEQQALQLAHENSGDYDILDESGIEMSFLDEVRAEVRTPSYDRVEGEVAKGDGVALRQGLFRAEVAKGGIVTNPRQHRSERARWPQMVRR